MHSCRLPAPRLEPGRRGPERFWALRRYEQIIDRVDECCQIDGRARGDDLAVGDRGFIDESGEGMVLDCRDQIWAMPPSTKISLPVMKRLSSEARKLTTFATSEGTPFRPIGAALAVWAKKPANWVSSRPTSR